MNTILFAAARHAKTKRDFLEKIREVHPAHPCHFNFASDRDRREYERILKGEPLRTGVVNPVIVVNGDGPGSGETSMVRALIGLKHGDQSPRSCMPTSEAEIDHECKAAIAEGRGYVFLDNIYCRRFFTSHAINLYSTVREISIRKFRGSSWEQFPVDLTIYITGNDLGLGKDLERRSTEIRLCRRSADQEAAA